MIKDDSSGIHITEHNIKMRGKIDNEIKFKIKGTMEVEWPMEHVLKLITCEDTSYAYRTFKYGDYLFVTESNYGLFVFEIEGDTISYITSVDDGGSAISLFVDNNYVYLANGVDGLRVYSFDGQTLSNVAHLSGISYCADVFVEGNDIYLAHLSYGISKYSFDGANFTRIGISGYNSTELKLKDGYLYLQNTSGYFKILTCNDNSCLTNLNTSNESNTVSCVWSDGTYIYVGVSDKFRIYTYDGNSFTFLKEQSIYTIYSIWSDDNYIYVGQNGYLTAYTFDGVTLTQKGFISISGAANSIWGDGTYIYVCQSSGGLNAFTFDGTNFTNVGSIYSGGISYGVWGDGTYIYHAGYTDGLRAYTFDGSNFTSVGHITLYYPVSVCGDGNYIYVGLSTGGIRAYTFNGSLFSYKSYKKDGTNCRHISTNGDYIFVSYSYVSTDDGIYVYKMDSEEGLITVGSYDGIYSYKHFCDGTYVYSCSYSHDTLDAMNFNGEEFSLVDKIDYPGYGLYINEDYIYTSYIKSIYVLRFDGSSISKVGEFSGLQDNSYYLAGNDEYLFVCGNSYISALSYNNEIIENLVTENSEGGYFRHIFSEDNDIYLSGIGASPKICLYTLLQMFIPSKQLVESSFTNSSIITNTETKSISSSSIEKNKSSLSGSERVNSSVGSAK